VKQSKPATPDEPVTGAPESSTKLYADLVLAARELRDSLRSEYVQVPRDLLEAFIENAVQREKALEDAIVRLCEATDWTALSPLHDDVLSHVLERIEHARELVGERGGK
jgi:hypothetical protein